jgi:amino acid adenylation domain-containing protein
MIYLLPHLIDEAAQRYPDHPAMRFGDRSLTYAELAQRANNLAFVLKELGVGPQARLGIYLNKSLESAVALYGIMKAGAAYVPLDPLAPAQRLANVIRHCQIETLVTHEPRQSGVQAILAEQVVLQNVVGLPAIEGEGLRYVSWQEVDRLQEPAPSPGNLMEQDLAYIMYTSGSTGTPKGIMHTHASGLSYARLAAHTYRVTHTDRLSNHSPLHFDMSTFDFFSGPLAGATTIIIPEAYTKLPASLAGLVEQERLTIWYSVPFALIQLLLRGGIQNRDFSALRWVLFGGEPFPPAHLQALMRLLPQARFSNVYGPAEVNQCTYYHLPALADAEASPADEPVPIGKIWDNSQGLLVDESDQPVADGEPGELLVRTPTMMRGYWARPDLTERAFYRCKRFDNYEEVFYRTGDLMQRMPDGNFRFLGRKDRQIKSRGYRVELDEIEHALTAVPAVEEGAAYALPDGEGSHKIEAAVILRAGEQAAPAEIKAHLAGMLPWYALPARLVIASEFPRTTSGKIDRRALQDQAVAGYASASQPAG